MVNLHFALYVLAFVFFVVASHPPKDSLVRWEWAAAACLALTLIV